MRGHVRCRRGRPAGGVRFSGLRIAALALLMGGLVVLAPLGAQQPPAPATSVGGEQTPIGQEDPAAAGTGRVAGVTTWDFVRMLLVLAAVVAVIYVVFRVIRKSGRRSAVENDLITVLGSRTLAGSRGLHLVRVGKSVYLVGSSESSVGLVSRVDDQETVDELLLQAAKQTPTAKRTFSEVLAGLLPQGAGKLALPEGPGFLRKQRDRLRRMGGLKAGT